MLGTSVSSELEGNPPLWITRQRTGVKDDIYVNNAKVLSQRSNMQYTNLNSRKQVSGSLMESIVRSSCFVFSNLVFVACENSRLKNAFVLWSEVTVSSGGINTSVPDKHQSY